MVFLILCALLALPARAQTSTALHKATAGGEVETVRKLVLGGADFRARDAAGKTPMELAREYPDRQVRAQLVDILITRGRSVQGSQPWTLEYAALRGQGDVVEMLLKMGADPNLPGSQGSTALQDASLKGYISVIRALLTHGAQIDVRDKDTGATPLHDAASLGRYDVVELLLIQGASPDAKDAKGVTPLRAAQQGKYPEIVDLLRKHGAKE